jgi:hypothetical protein
MEEVVIKHGLFGKMDNKSNRIYEKYFLYPFGKHLQWIKNR